MKYKAGDELYFKQLETVYYIENVDDSSYSVPLYEFISTNGSEYRWTKACWVIDKAHGVHLQSKLHKVLE